ncbi:type IV pilin protein, partial [Neisseria lactamica]
MKNVQKGFTLLELLIAVAILSILTLIAYPSYKAYTRRIRLSEVKSTLLMNAQNLERYYRQKGTFDNYDPKKLKQNKYFNITLSKVNPDHFTLQAVPDPATNEGETCIVTLNDGGTLSAAG